MKKNPLLVFLGITGGIFILVLVALVGALYTAFGEKMPSIGANTIGVVEVKGIIIDPKPFIKQLEKYRENKDVKAVLVRLDSPGGVVGPSQEMYDEVLRVRQAKKPVVASLGSLAASGAYYIAAGADRIVTNPGTITGSIGVIMEMADLSRLFEWVRVRPYVIKSGKYKDIGSSNRPMTPEEHEIMQAMIDSVYMQFKKAVAQGRGLKLEEVSKLAEGKVYSGEQAVKNGLADQLGGMEEAIQVAAKLGNIKGKPEVYYPPPKRKHIWDMFTEKNDEDDDDAAHFGKVLKQVLGLDLNGQLLYLMPNFR